MIVWVACWTLDILVPDLDSLLALSRVFHPLSALVVFTAISSLSPLAVLPDAPDDKFPHPYFEDSVQLRYDDELGDGRSDSELTLKLDMEEWGKKKKGG